MRNNNFWFIWPVPFSGKLTEVNARKHAPES
jgi:hypothetical protein|uniref:Uncharacterized protein n=1 Tax=Variovorax paradoxus (strain S110) TaxID=543728 RepID=C5CK48_VARPS